MLLLYIATFKMAELGLLETIDHTYYFLTFRVKICFILLIKPAYKQNSIQDMQQLCYALH